MQYSTTKIYTAFRVLRTHPTILVVCLIAPTDINVLLGWPHMNFQEVDYQIAKFGSHNSVAGYKLKFVPQKYRLQFVREFTLRARCEVCGGGDEDLRGEVGCC